MWHLGPAATFSLADVLNIVSATIRAVTALLVVMMGLSEWQRTRRETFRLLSFAFALLTIHQVARVWFASWSLRASASATWVAVPVHLMETAFLVQLAHAIASHEKRRPRDVRRIARTLLQITLVLAAVVQAAWFFRFGTAQGQLYRLFWGERVLDLWDLTLLGLSAYLATVLEPEIRVLPALSLLILGKATYLANILFWQGDLLWLKVAQQSVEALSAILLLVAAHFGIVAETFTDPLTRLYNRRYFMTRAPEEFTRAARRRSRSAILVMDLDHFKRYNDTYGHVAGDKMLRAMAKILNQYLRPYDILCRWGGEEFIALLPDTDADTAAGVAERLRIAVADTLGSPDRPTPVTISIGVADGPEQGHDWRDVVQEADEALYRAKRWRNRVVVSETSHG